MASSYDLQGKVAIVTGGGSGLNLAVSRALLEAGCSVMIADLRLRPEAESLVEAYPSPPEAGDDSNSSSRKPYVVFHATDVTDWAQLSSLWETALATFGKVHVVINGAGFLHPSSSFWRPPGINPQAGDDAHQGKNGAYKIFSINTIGPVRLAQLAINYWLENRDVEGNILFVASNAGYSPLFTEPLYAASKAALVGLVNSLAPLRQIAGIRTAALCPGTILTPLVAQQHLEYILSDDDPGLTPEQCAGVGLRVLTEPQFGEGSIVETNITEKQGGSGGHEVAVRRVPVELLYSTTITAKTREKHAAEATRFAGVLVSKGMRSEEL